nr:unnamed protein product [Spirometra erinaceieuropaei]
MPKWLLKAENKVPRSSITKHLLDTGHTVDQMVAFKVLFRATTGRLLRFVNKCIRQARMEYESKIIRQAEQKPKILFHYLNSRLKNKDPVAVLKDGNGVEITENTEKAENLDQYFASVFTRETEFRSRSASNAVETAGRVLDSILFPTAVVERELKNLKEAKSSGPDNIPAKFLKELANELSKQLAQSSARHSN